MFFRYALERWWRCVGDIFVAPARGRVDDIARHSILAVRPSIVIDRLHHESLDVSEVVTLRFELRLALRKSLNHLVHRD
jgi:hypothetical protein